MQYKDVFSFDLKWTYKTVCLFVFLIALPNLLGMLNIPTPWGFKIHFFQMGIFIAALIYGPFGGLLSGFIGSMYSAVIMNNPYIAIGNAILGFFVGLFARYGFNTVIAVLVAYLIQLPWLIATDHYLVHLPIPSIKALIIALLISNIIWAVAAHYTFKQIKQAVL